MLLSLSDGQGRYRTTAEPDAPLVNETTHALVTAALAALYQQTRSEPLAQALRPALRTLWQDDQASLNIAALPWYVTAHHRAAHLLAGDDPDQQQALAQRERKLGQLVTDLSQQQVIERPRLGPTDVVGGFELQTAAPNTPPNPDWRTAQLLQFLAICIRDQGIVGDQSQLGWLVTAGLAGRFINQLMADEPACYYMADPRQALGGVRLTLWDNRLAVAPAAVSLLALTELQETLIDFTTTPPVDTAPASRTAP
jgi:hypothetical protein